MIGILPPFGKYKYDTWRILPVKSYIDNSVCLQSCIQNVNKHFLHRCRGGSQYLLPIYRLHGIILTSIISHTDLSAALWLFVVVTGQCFIRPELLTVHHSFLRFTPRFISTRLLWSLIRKSAGRATEEIRGWALLVVIKCIYLLPTYLHFIQDIEDRCLLLMSSTSFVDLPF
jgi:hypothetical protein